MAFTSTGSCSISHSVIYTGLHTHENGQYGLNNNRYFFTTSDPVETAPKIFSDLGHPTGIIEKFMWYQVLFTPGKSVKRVRLAI